jgi:hypothetical protein
MQKLMAGKFHKSLPMNDQSATPLSPAMNSRRSIIRSPRRRAAKSTDQIASAGVLVLGATLAAAIIRRD